MSRVNTGTARRLLEELRAAEPGAAGRCPHGAWYSESCHAGDCFREADSERARQVLVVFEVFVDGTREGTTTLSELYDSDIDQCESEGVLRELDGAAVGAVVRCGGGAMPVFEYRRVA